MSSRVYTSPSYDRRIMPETSLRRKNDHLTSEKNIKPPLHPGAFDTPQDSFDTSDDYSSDGDEEEEDDDAEALQKGLSQTDFAADGNQFGVNKSWSVDTAQLDESNDANGGMDRRVTELRYESTCCNGVDDTSLPIDNTAMSHDNDNFAESDSLHDSFELVANYYDKPDEQPR